MKVVNTNPKINLNTSWEDISIIRCKVDQTLSWIIDEGGIIFRDVDPCLDIIVASLSCSIYK